MADNRRSPGRRPRSRTGQAPRREAARSTRSASAAAPSRRPRMTGRTAILLLVVGVLSVSWASSMRAYLQQREQLAELRADIAAHEASISELVREKRRWQDPAYVAAQARERFGYVMPGETSYVVLDETGTPLNATATLTDPEDVVPTTSTAWFAKAWQSVELAGQPAKAEPPPASEIDGTSQ